MGYSQELHRLDREIQEQVNLTETDADAARRFAAELEELKADHQRTLKLVADLYTAGTGRSGVGPIQGVVEDVADERHRLHRMIHALRSELIVMDFDGSHIATREEADELAGEEPRCAECHGYGVESGQELVPVQLHIVWPMGESTPLPDLDKLDAALASVGLKRVEE